MTGLVSVVICVYTSQRLEQIDRAINSVLGQSHSPVEIIVVVDHNPRLHAVLEQNYPDVLVIHNGRAKGLSGARNTGVSVARGPVVAFLDDDAAAAPNWLESLLRILERSTVVGVGGYAKPIWARGRPAWFPPEFDWVVGCSHAGLPQQTSEVRNLIGANMAFRRDVFSSVGGFRAEF